MINRYIYNYMRAIAIAIAAVMSISSSVAQVFPTLWDVSEYDYQHGVNGRLYVINTDYNSRLDKAYIFAANFPGISTPKDLMRLTLDGVTTLNSPKAGNDVELHFCTQGIRDGEISSSQRVLRVHGMNKLSLGTANNYSVLDLTTQNITASTNMYVDRDGIRVRFGLDNNQSSAWIGTETNSRLVLGTGLRNIMTLDNANRTMYVGLSFGDIDEIRNDFKEKYSLFVKKGILSEDYVMAPVTSWSDSVFDPNYQLMPISQLHDYIKDNHHLPNVPTQAEVMTNGYSQHEINKILLQKIEELSLYVIQLQEQIQQLKEGKSIEIE